MGAAAVSVRRRSKNEKRDSSCRPCEMGVVRHGCFGPQGVDGEEVMVVFTEAVKQKNCCTGGLLVTVRCRLIHTGRNESAWRTLIV